MKNNCANWITVDLPKHSRSGFQMEFFFLLIFVLLSLSLSRLPNFHPFFSSSKPVVVSLV